MGYFSYFVKCVIRKSVNFIFRKDNFFKFCCILFFGFIIFTILSNTKVYGATSVVSDTTYYDGYLNNKNLMDNMQNDLILRLEQSDTEYKDEIIQKLNDNNLYFFVFYGSANSNVDNINSFPNDKQYLHVVFCEINSTNSTTESLNWWNNGFVNTRRFVPTVNGYRYTFASNLLVQREYAGNSYSIYYPSYFVNYRSDDLTNYLLSYYDKSSDELQDIIQESTNTIVQSNQQTQNTIKEQTEFLTSNTISDNSITLPQDTTQDDTGIDDELNFIFNDIMSAFTDTSSNNSLTLTFPFTNQTFDISYASVYNGVFEKNNSMAYLKRIIQLGYWYIVAVFVIKDISNKVNKVKTGDIDKIQTGNIKEDLL